MSLFDKIDVSGLVRDHIATLVSRRPRGVRAGKARGADLLLFFILPLGVAVPLGAFGTTVATVSTELVTVMSILAGLLFSLLLLLYEAVRRRSGLVTRHEQRRRTLLKETHANTSFAILLAIATVVGCLAATIFSKDEPLVRLISGAVYYLASVFVLTLLMILKRARTLMNIEFEDESGTDNHSRDVAAL